ncbi:TonB-dependent receptor domain-containing protein [Paraglaciecola arctica]|uniref:Iron complex outermembrane recepter protein n=1 Tax=Paraglaciecola arctica BSs20135 TaxID=493475 RepID=K6YWT5_9ALTE|nr:TonB-dependent receptor [Paraglaciecola arctica]GAC21198.1 iron complex outermembrane recepter protein [Paraglaciecola arctica BSs20135]
MMMIKTNMKVLPLCLAISAAFSTAPSVFAADTADKRVERISVTGSLIRRADLEESMPVTVFDKEMIEITGAQNMIDIANNLTMNSGSRFTNEEARIAGTSQFNIRGLGPGATLTLINGRRAGIAPVATNLGNQFFDINQLPIAMIERIEFLTDGASSTYGSQAVAGVANIITRSGFEGLEVSGRYQDSSNETFDINLVSGAKGERGQVNIYATLSGQTINYRSDFDFINERVGGNGNVYDSRFLSSTGSPGSYQLAQFDNEGVITPTGSVFADPNCEDAGGVLQSGLCKTHFIDQLAIMPKENRFQVFSEFEYDVTDNVKAYGELSFSRNQVQAILGAPFYSNGLVKGGSMFVPADHPFNFFVENEAGNGLNYINPTEWDNNTHQAVDIVAKSRPFGYFTNGDSSSGINNHLDIDFDYYRAVTGFEAELSDTWILDTSYVYSLGERSQTTRLGMSSTTFNDAVLSGAFNPFGIALSDPDYVSPKDGTSIAANSEEELGNIIHDLTDNTRSEQQVLEAVASGELFDLDSGMISMAIGSQYRYENYSYTPDSLSGKGLGLGSTPSSSIAGETNVFAVFAELFIPIYDDIEIQTALRYEDYDTAGSTIDPKVSVKWDITDELMLRSSFGTSFQAPTNLQTGDTIGGAFIEDPVTVQNGVAVCNPTGASNYVYINTRGSDDLEPSKAKNWNLGLVYQPTKALMMKADFWSFDYTDLIAQDSSATGIVNAQCAGVANGDKPINDPRITRSPEGQLREIALNYVNTGSVKTSGLDFSVNYDMDLASLGELTLGLDSTYVAAFDIVALDGADTIKGAGSFNSANAFKAMPKLRANTRATWRFDDHVFNASLRYISSYDNDLTADENDNIAAYTTVDLKYTYTFGSDAGNTSVNVGASNIFDKAPPTLGDGVRPGYDATTHDIRGRVVFAGFTHKFN